VIAFVATPIQNTLVRTQEYEADIFGLNAARQPDGFAEAALLLGGISQDGADRTGRIRVLRSLERMNTHLFGDAMEGGESVSRQCGKPVRALTAPAAPLGRSADI
jgi:Zn-dependent protease with chaperone function